VSSDKARRGQKRAAKARARQRRLAQDEARRERHVGLIVERQGDPRFAQRIVDENGDISIKWNPVSVTGREVTQSLKSQLRAFKEKFGRDAGPDDPVFFDPDSDVPAALTEEKIVAAYDELIESGQLEGTQLAYIKAARQLGYIVTQENRHMFSAAEVDAWTGCVSAALADED